MEGHENAESSSKIPKNVKLTFMDSLKFNFRKKWGSQNREPQVSCRKIVRVEPFKPEQAVVEASGNIPAAGGSRGQKESLQQHGEQVKVLGNIEVELHHQNRRPAETGKGIGATQYQPRKRKTSFDLFLASIPKLDPVDRTVGWVLKHPDLEVGVGDEDSIRSMSARTECNTSISRYESERGTCGRGTPPSVIEGQPRLDDLFRQFQMKQASEAKFVTSLTSQGRMHSGMSQTRGRVLGHRPPLQPSTWNTHPARRGGGGGNGRSSRLFQDMPPKDGPSANILHKNSYYYNQSNNENIDRGKVCEWEACQARFLTVRELHRHVHDRHLSRLPVSNMGAGPGPGGGGDRQGRSAMLYCHWRHCSDSTLYTARYKLMLHLQRAHFDKMEEADRDKRDPQKLQAYFQNTKSLETKRRGSSHTPQYTAAMTTMPYTARYHQHINFTCSSSGPVAEFPDPLSEEQRIT